MDRLRERAQCLYERAQCLYERAQCLYEAAAAVFRLPQDRSAFAEALFNEPPVRYELADAACENTLVGISAAEVLGATHARRRELAPSDEPLSQLACTHVEVIGRFDEYLCRSVRDRYMGSPRTGMLALAREAGFREARHVSAATLTQHYFANRADGLRPPKNSEEFLVAVT
jgi:hypothetical protein